MSGLSTACANAPDPKKDNSEMIQLFINAGASVNHQDDFGRTPLIMAATSGNLVAAQILINSRAEVNMVTPGGETALMRAASNGHVEIV